MTDFGVVVGMRILLVLAVACLIGVGCTRVVAERWGDGTIRRTGTVTSGVQVGVWTYYHQGGAVAAVGGFAKSMQEGEWIYYHPNGQVWSQGVYARGLKQGSWTFYRPDGTLQTAGRYRNDRQEGQWTTYGSDGRSVAAVGWYQFGVADGPWVEFAADGSVVTAGVHVAGVRVGPWRHAGKILAGTLPTGWSVAPGESPVSTVINDAAGRRQFGTVTHLGKEWLLDARNVTPLLVCLDGPELLVIHTIPQSGAADVPPVAPVEAAPIEAAPVADNTLTSMSAMVSPEDQPPPLPIDIESDPLLESAASVLEPVAILPGLWTTDQEEHAGRAVDRFRGVEAQAPAWEKHSAPTEVNRARPAWHGKPLPQTRFLGADGQVFDLKRWRGKAVALVVMRGFSGQVCLYCAAQTVALVEAAPRLRAQGLEVLVVYPGPAEAVPAFVRAVASLNGKPLELPVALDPGLQLVRKLELAGNLALPATFLLDQEGIVRWTYVGTSIADRPSVQLIESAAKSLRP